MALIERSCSPLWSGLPVESLLETTRFSPAASGGYFRRKLWLDRILGGSLLLLLWPLLAVLMFAVRLSSRGPAIYRQTRVGLGGRIFVMYKLRSMRMDAEKVTGPQWAIIDNDPRVTPLGYWLRKLHLDELPQLINLLRGEMSLVGPRPERPEFSSVLSEQIPGYLDRLQVLPGITGLAQVNLPPDTDLESVRRKLAFDLEYIRMASWHLDLRLVLCTALRLVGIRGGATAAWLGLRRTMCHPPGTTARYDEPMNDEPMTPHALATSDRAADRFIRVAESGAQSSREQPGVGVADGGVMALRS
jgi:lipopolysaccharide/colanic/teichoic acid biosynthesis glycosyltransferase